MINPWWGIVGVLSAFFGLLAVIAAASHRVGPEVLRKLLHAGMGLVILSFPVLFRDVWPVVVIVTVTTVTLLAVRHGAFPRTGSIIHGIGRHSLGEVWYAVAVVVLFALARQPVLFQIPILTLALADTAAALVGKRYGRHRYRLRTGSKSIEGSAAFFVIAAVCTGIPLLALADESATTALWIAVMAAVVTTVLEAFASGGVDNLLIPLGSYATLIGCL